MEGTDQVWPPHMRCAIERLVVQPWWNLLASGQTRRGDCIRVSHEDGVSCSNLVVNQKPCKRGK